MTKISDNILNLLTIYLQICVIDPFASEKLRRKKALICTESQQIRPQVACTVVYKTVFSLRRDIHQ